MNRKGARYFNHIDTLEHIAKGELRILIICLRTSAHFCGRCEHKKCELYPWENTSYSSSSSESSIPKKLTFSPKSSFRRK